MCYDDRFCKFTFSLYLLTLRLSQPKTSEITDCDQEDQLPQTNCTSAFVSPENVGRVGGGCGRPCKKISPHLIWSTFKIWLLLLYSSRKDKGKVKVVPYSKWASVPELIPVLGSQPAGDWSNKPGGRLPLPSASSCTTGIFLLKII